MELVITVTIIGVLVFVGATALRTSDTQETRGAAFDIVDLMRQARYVAARQNVAVVVQVVPYGQSLSDGGQTRGLAQSFLGTTSACPQTIAAGTPALATLDYGTSSDDPMSAGIARVTPSALAGDGPNDGFCVRPNGRILDNSTGQPIRPAGLGDDEMAGKAHIWVQWNPIREVGGELVVPRVEIEVPFNGLVRIPQ